MIKDTINFTGMESFLKSHKFHTDALPEGSVEELLTKSGIWIKFKEHTQVVNVSSMDENGVFLIDRFVDWEDLAEYYTFLDDSPCCD